MQWLLALASKGDFWSALFASVFGAAAGAWLAFTLERHRRQQERIERELGQCHALVYMLTHMVSMLEDFCEQLFLVQKAKLGRPPKWHEIAGLDGAPQHSSGFVIRDYVFLLDLPHDGDKAPELLDDIYYAVTKFEAILLLINSRTVLWHDFKDQQAAGLFQRGTEGTTALAQTGAIAKRVREHTVWLAEDLPEVIAKFHSLFPALYAVLRLRYPKESFLVPTPAVPRPKHDGPLIDQSTS
jgi:hypothetical protein